MKFVRILVLAILLVAVGHLSAGEPLADFSISAEVLPGGVMPPGTEGIVTITVTNLGPDEGTPLFRMRRTDNGTGFFDYPPLHFEFPGALLTGPCVNVPLNLPPGDPFLGWIVHDMVVGDSIDCEFAFTVAETSVTAQIGQWSIERFSGPDDPNGANNVADVLLRFAELSEPEPIPLLSFTGALLMLLMLGLLACHGVLRRAA